MGLKISQLSVRNTITGSEIIPIVDLGLQDNFTITLDTIRSIVRKSDVGLSNVDNTSDLDKPISQSVIVALNGKANIVHNHSVQDVTGLQAVLDAKATLIHTHTTSAISDFTTAVTNLIQSTTSPSDVAVGLLEW